MAQQRNDTKLRRLQRRRSGTSSTCIIHALPLSTHWSINQSVILTPRFAQFALALYALIDASLWSHSALNGSSRPEVHISFIDWIPLIFSSLGMLIINSIDKSRLSADSFSYSGDGVAWKARVVLFMGFAALAGGLAGGVCVLVLKYVVPEVMMPALWMGVANVVGNGLVGLSAVVLWVSQNMEDDYTYNLQL